MENERILISGVIFSVLLLISLLWLQSRNSSILKLPVQWLVLAVLPIAFSLFAGGFISKFKGFGVELETNLNAPISSVSLTASDAVADIPGDEKRGMGYIESLSRERKLSIRWLLFKNGKSNYYSSSVIASYIRELPNLEYFEIRSEQGGIIGFIPISEFKSIGDSFKIEIDQNRLEQFVSAIGQNSVKNQFAGALVDLKIFSDESLVNVLRKLRSENAKFAAVVAPSGKYLGVILTQDVERKIANSVLVAEAS